MTADSTSKPSGRTMLIIFWLLALGLLTAIFGRWEKAQYNPNQNPAGRIDGAMRELTLASNRQHHYVATGTINGKEAVFLLDTGATQVAIPAHLAARYGLDAGRSYPVNTANGTVVVQSTEIDELKLGPLTFRNLKASLNPGMDGDEILLGMNALKQVELIQRGGQLTLRQYQ